MIDKVCYCEYGFVFFFNNSFIATCFSILLLFILVFSTQHLGCNNTVLNYQTVLKLVVILWPSSAIMAIYQNGGFITRTPQLNLDITILSRRHTTRAGLDIPHSVLRLVSQVLQLRDF